MDNVTQTARLPASVASWGLRLALASAASFALGILLAILARLFPDELSLIGIIAHAVIMVPWLIWFILWPTAGVLGIVAAWKAVRLESPAREFAKVTVTFVLCLLSLIVSCWMLYGFASSI